MTFRRLSFDVAIHGSGLVAQALALLLAKQGLRVVLAAPRTLLTPPTPSPSLQEESLQVRESSALPDVRAFALGPKSRALLRSINAWPDLHDTTAVQAMHVYGDAGAELVFGSGARTHQPAKADEDALNWIVDVNALQALLLQRMSSEPLVKSLDAEKLTHTEALHAQLHVLCDSRDTQLMQAIGIAPQTIRYPQQALAARLETQLPHQGIARQFFLASGEILALLPMKGQEVSLVWSLSDERAQAMLRCETAEFTQALESDCQNILGEMHLVTMRRLWPLQLNKMSQWTGVSESLGCWVLAGDAAHTLHPLAGQGFNLGLADVAALAQALHSVQGDAPIFKPSSAQLAKTLRRYARERKAAFAPIAFVTDGLQLLFARESEFVKQARNWGMTWLNMTPPLKDFLIQQVQ